MLAGVLGCRVTVLPIKYLGMPLGVKYKDVNTYSYQQHFGEFACIPPIHVNYLSQYCYQIRKIQCRVLWGDEEGKRRYHLMKWGDVKKLIWEGGLDLRSLGDMNTASTCKMVVEIHQRR